MDIISRKEAKEQGLKRYFTGKPCKRGHVSERATQNKGCLECDRERKRAWREANPEKHKEIKRAYREANPEKDKEQSRAWREANREKAKESCRAWNEANPDKRNALTSKRRAAKLQRTPAWADHESIRLWYLGARILGELLGETYHVDHILPMQGEKVSGLHTFENLQLLPGSENCSKRNSFHA